MLCRRLSRNEYGASTRRLAETPCGLLAHGYTRVVQVVSEGRLYPGMPLQGLNALLTPEERDEIAVTFRTISEAEPGQQLEVREDFLENFQRAFAGLALDGYSSRMRLLVRGKLETHAPDAQDYVARALDSALKARAADPSNSVYLLHIAESLELAQRVDAAMEGYAAFIEEQSREPDGSAGRALSKLAQDRLAELGKHS